MESRALSENLNSYIAMNQSQLNVTQRMNGYPAMTPTDFFMQWPTFHQIIHPTAIKIPSMHIPIQQTAAQVAQALGNNDSTVRKPPQNSMDTTKNNNTNDSFSLDDKFTDDSDGGSDVMEASEYDLFDVPIVPVSAEPSTDDFVKFTTMALRGCDLAEKLAFAHRSRPCFKKIDSLCARLKQDLVRPDGVLANINSQGIAWAVKDFIFVFTRIINAWTIIKGYVHNTPDGLSKVKSSFSKEFISSFLKWQEATTDFVDNLIQSYINLDQLVQSQRNVFQRYDAKSSNNNNNNNNNKRNSNDNSSDNGKSYQNHDSESVESLLNELSQEVKNLAHVVDNSEEAQRKVSENGTYLRTGLYNPLQKDKMRGESSPSKNATNNIQQMKQFVTSTPTKFVDACHKNEILNWIGQNAKLNEPSTTTTTTTGKNVACHGESGDGRNEESAEMNRDKKISTDKAVSSVNYSDYERKLVYLMEKVSLIDETKYFFAAHFTKNYFPDFLKIVPNYLDLRTIILRSQAGNYKNIYELVHDLRQIVYSAKIYLQKNPQKFLAELITGMEKEMDKILAEDIFLPWNFSKITGDPHDKIPRVYEN